MLIPGQPTASPALRKALWLLGRGKLEDAELVVTKAARAAKGLSGSGSHPLALAYADMARFHYRIGDYKKAAAEFKHACGNPLPDEIQGRRDRLAFMFGFAACLESLAKPGDAEKVLRQCVAFARNLHGPTAPGYALALEPLARFLLAAGKLDEAVELIDESYGILWQHGDVGIALVISTRAEIYKAVDRPDDPYADLAELPDAIAIATVTAVVGRLQIQDAARARNVLSDLLRFVEKRFDDGHPAIADSLAAIVHHEMALGEGGNAVIQSAAARRSLWAYTLRRVPVGILEDLEIAFEPGGTIHLVPHLTRDPSPTDAVHLEAVLTQAVDDLYTRPSFRVARVQTS